MVTIKEIAKEAGISPGSVSVVLNGKGDQRRIAPETQRRIQDIAERLGYRRNTLARSLQTGQSNLVGIVGHTHPPHHVLRTRTAARHLLDSGYQITLQDLAWRPEQEAQLLTDLLGLRVEGLYLESGAGAPDASDPAFAILCEQANRGLPMVRLDTAKGLPVDVVTVDREQDAYLAMEHILDLGHRQIVYIIDNESSAPLLQDRLRGVERSLMEHDLPISDVSFMPPRLDSNLQGRGQYAAGYRAMVQVLTKRPHPTAVLAVNDYVASGAVAAIIEAGLSVPDDIAIVGSIGYLEAELGAVPLTTVAYPFQDMAKVAASMLIERLGGIQEKPRTVKLSPQLIVRRSCGARQDYQALHHLTHGLEPLKELNAELVA